MQFVQNLDWCLRLRSQLELALLAAPHQNYIRFLIAGVLATRGLHDLRFKWEIFNYVYYKLPKFQVDWMSD